MSYTTNFTGQFNLNRKLDPETHSFLKKLAKTRRMGRNVDPKYGTEGEFYVDGEGFMGQLEDPTIIGYDTPPSTQPGLWCQWVPSDNGKSIKWDEDEKFYYYIEWLKYIINKILTPKGYTLEGIVEYQGEEDSDDHGYIVAIDGEVIDMPIQIKKIIGKKDIFKFLRDPKNLPLLLHINEKFDEWIEKKFKS